MPASISSNPKGTLKQSVMLTAYRTFGCILLPALPIALLARSRKQPAYRQRMLERFGLIDDLPDKPSIVIHGASLGEITALKPIIEQCLIDLPQYHIVITSFTPAGSTKVKQLFGDTVSHYYLPFDIWPCIKTFIARTRPVMMIFMETEIWPSLIHQAFKQQIELILINARISDKALPKYQKYPALITPTLRRFSRVICQSAINQERFLALGADAKALSISGNLKFDSKPVAISESITAIKTLTKSRSVWLIASSHADEEQLLIEVLLNLRQKIPNLLCLWAPRHIERFESVAELCERHKLEVARRSQNQDCDRDTDVLLIDTIGELAQFYSVAKVATVCGSFNNTGGHNPLEPLLQQSAVTFGPNMANSHETVELMLSSGAAYQHQKIDANAISQDIYRILTDELTQQVYLEAGARFLSKHQGSVQKTMAIIKEVIAENG